MTIQTNLSSYLDKILPPAPNKVAALLREPENPVLASKTTAGLSNDRPGICPFCDEPMSKTFISKERGRATMPVYFCEHDQYAAPEPITPEG